MISAMAVTMMLAMADSAARRRPAPPPPPPPPLIMVAPPPPILYVPPAPPAPPAPPPPPPPPPTGRYEPARARVNLGSLIGEADYPASALRAREEGIVVFRLVIGPNGRVGDCVVTQSSGSAALDSATCRILASRARFIPARDLQGNPVSDRLNGRIVWRIANDLDRPWAPAIFVEQVRATAAGTVSCWEGWDNEPPTEETCRPQEAIRMAARARAARTALDQSFVTRLTPEGMTEIADRPRGELFLAADAVFTIGPDGRLLECRAIRNAWVGRNPPGLPPDPCADWDIGTNLFLPAPDGTGNRRVNVTVRGYVGAAMARPASSGPTAPPPINPGQARALAELNWQSCLEDRARRFALDAVDKRGPIPAAETVLGACAEQEERVRTLAVGDEAESGQSWTTRREQAAAQVSQLLATTYRAHNYD